MRTLILLCFLLAPVLRAQTTSYTVTVNTLATDDYTEDDTYPAMAVGARGRFPVTLAIHYLSGECLVTVISSTPLPAGNYYVSPRGSDPTALRFPLTINSAGNPVAIHPEWTLKPPRGFNNLGSLNRW